MAASMGRSIFKISTKNCLKNIFKHDLIKIPLLTTKGKSFAPVQHNFQTCHLISTTSSLGCHAFEARDVKVVPSKGIQFDTLAAVKNLQNSGFTSQQSEGIVNLLVDIFGTTNEQHRHHMVTKEQQEIVVQQLLANLESVKKDMMILEKSEFQALRNETERLLIEIKHLRAAVDDDLSKLGSTMKLDINLERARNNDQHHDMDGKYDKLDNRIDTEIANLKTMFEKYRNDIFKFAGGSLISCLTITLGFYRLWS